MSVVYFIQVAPDGPIKIGTTRGHIGLRMRALQQASPHVLKWIGYFEGGTKEEGTAHKRLASSRFRGEWFHPTVEVLAFIAEMSPGFDEAVATREIFHDDLRAAVRQVLPLYNTKHPVRLALCKAADIPCYALANWLDRRAVLTAQQANVVSRFLSSAAPSADVAAPISNPCAQIGAALFSNSMRS